MENYKGILKYAMEMEKQGFTFYKENAVKFSSPTARDLFEKLAAVEMEHYEFLKEQLSYYESKNEIKDVTVDIDKENNLFNTRFEREQLGETMMESLTPELTILRMAYLIEKDFAEFYRSMSDRATEANAKKLFYVLATWEEGHEELFKAEYDRRMEEFINGQWG
ncbi:ferritin-like domain-containing protein [Alkaliphilus peptidifermentans]|uniref:Rubrerythrin n=1 Tax=Alkaliphilus peptidifermentans DSM 18978 TaxID=1120976 RepID=A0A1G5KYD2_9FIRM|nr:ferritin family protein [Alkaliphilus peptidifermentans]SCZ05128.1 Rubrerythrin [Alkaliphilus peptidifermentans DSM 18978]